MKENIVHYLDQFRKTRSEDAFFALLHVEDTYVPTLIEAYRRETDIPTKAALVEIIWQHKTPAVLDFLKEAVQHENQHIWKNALDGIVSIGGKQALDVLEKEKQHLIEHSGPSHESLEWIDESIQQIEQNEHPD